MEVSKSLSEVLFFNWNNIETDTKTLLMNHISTQQDAVISSQVTISAKFAKLYEYCDLLYEKKHVGRYHF